MFLGQGEHVHESSVGRETSDRVEGLDHSVRGWTDGAFATLEHVLADSAYHDRCSSTLEATGP